VLASVASRYKASDADAELDSLPLSIPAGILGKGEEHGRGTGSGLTGF
jgi:hypothetical protein